MKLFGIKTSGKSAVAALALLGAGLLSSTPAKADVGFGISFGYDGGSFSDPCDYYDYYDQAPPWGLPPDYCEYPVYFEPVYYGGSWYRGPIYYRWYGGDRMYWLNGGWRRDQWRGSRPNGIRWTDRGGWRGRDGWNNHGRGDFRNSHNRGGGWGQRDNRSDFRGDRGGNRGGYDQSRSHDRSGWNRGGGSQGGSWQGRGYNGGSPGGGRDGWSGGPNRGGPGGGRDSWSGGPNRGGPGGGRDSWSGGHNRGGQGGSYQGGGGRGGASGGPSGGRSGGGGQGGGGRSGGGQGGGHGGHQGR